MRPGLPIAVAATLFASGAAPALGQASMDTDRNLRSPGGERPLDENPWVPGRTHERFSFEELDVNNDGAIVQTEAAFKPQLAANFDYADKNGDGSLNAPEFEAAMAMSAEWFGEGERSAHKRRIFNNLDMDSDGVVSKTEAQWRPALAGGFAAVDSNGDGSLDLREFSDISLSELGAQSRGSK